MKLPAVPREPQNPALLGDPRQENLEAVARHVVASHEFVFAHPGRQPARETVLGDTEVKRVFLLGIRGAVSPGQPGGRFGDEEPPVALRADDAGTGEKLQRRGHGRARDLERVGQRLRPEMLPLGQPLSADVLNDPAGDLIGKSFVQRRILSGLTECYLHK